MMFLSSINLNFSLGYQNKTLLKIHFIFHDSDSSIFLISLYYPNMNIDNMFRKFLVGMEGEGRFIKGLVNKMLRIQISDGRVLIGSLLCTDRDQNLIMGGAAEYWHDETGEWVTLLETYLYRRELSTVQVKNNSVLYAWHLI